MTQEQIRQDDPPVIQDLQQSLLEQPDAALVAIYHPITSLGAGCLFPTDPFDRVQVE